MTPREIQSLVSWLRVLQEVGVDPGHHGRTCCPIRGGDNPQAFVYKDDKGRAHCFSCGFHGDKLDFLQTVLAVDFRTALTRLAAIAGVNLEDFCKLNSRELERARAHRAALNAARDSYRAWQRQKFNDLVEFKFQELRLEIEAAEIAYRSFYRRPGLYTFAEQIFWTARLGQLYDRQSQLENDLDILVYRANEKARFQWWRQEREGVGGDRLSA